MDFKNFENGLIRFKAVRIIKRRLLRMGFKTNEILALMSTKRMLNNIDRVVQGILIKKGLAKA